MERKISDEQFKESVENDERKYPPTLLFIFIIFLVGVTTFGLSYAAMNYIGSNQTINTIISNITGNDTEGRYIITYVENYGDISPETGINLRNQYPTPDEVGKMFVGENYTYNFSLLLGNATSGSYYEISVIPNDGNTIKEEDVKIYLEKNGTGVEDSFRDNGKVKTFSDYKASKYSDEVKGKVISKGYVTDDDVKNGKINFVMRMWLSEDAETPTDYKEFGVKVNIYAAK